MQIITTIVVLRAFMGGMLTINVFMAFDFSEAKLNYTFYKTERKTH